LIPRGLRRLAVSTAVAAAVAAVITLAGCQVAPVKPPVAPPVPPHAVYAPAGFDSLPGWRDDDVATAWPAFLESCKAFAARATTIDAWRDVCARAAAIDFGDKAAIRAYLEANLAPWRVTSSDGSTSGRVTGYYEPLISGSLTPTGPYTTPIYAPPDDLLTIDLVSLYPELAGKRVRGRLDGRRVVPYWTRADIDAGRADTEGKVLAWVADPVDAFFLQVQGSGRIRLDDGTMLRVGYADQNGQPYRSIARVLIDRGEMTADQASMQSIRAWGKAHMSELPALLEANPSYVFFRIVPPPAPGSLDAMIDGPIGSLGVPLLAGRTIAVDRRSIPLGAPVWLVTTYPLSDEPLQRLVLAQDTGGAISGPLRVDFFWGFGDEAGSRAGAMREDGRLWVLWPRGARPPN
jgi:membrane-bound lytic murein transglycosylase A